MKKIPYPWAKVDAEERSDAHRLTVVVGLSGSYKTWVAIAIARHARTQGVRVALVCSEDDRSAARRVSYFDEEGYRNDRPLLFMQDLKTISEELQFLRSVDEPALVVADAVTSEDLAGLADLAATRRVAVLATMTTARMMPGRVQRLPQRLIRVSGPQPRSGRILLDVDMPEFRRGFELTVERRVDGPLFGELS